MGVAASAPLLEARRSKVGKESCCLFVLRAIFASINCMKIKALDEFFEKTVSHINELAGFSIVKSTPCLSHRTAILDENS